MTHHYQQQKSALYGALLQARQTQKNTKIHRWIISFSSKHSKQTLWGVFCTNIHFNKLTLVPEPALKIKNQVWDTASKSAVTEQHVCLSMHRVLFLQHQAMPVNRAVTSCHAPVLLGQWHNDIVQCDVMSRFSLEEGLVHETARILGRAWKQLPLCCLQHEGSHLYS